MFGLGMTELLIILGLVVLVFGARRLPELGSGLGKGIKNFKAGMAGDEIDVTPRKDQVGEGEEKEEPSSGSSASRPSSASSSSGS